MLKRFACAVLIMSLAAGCRSSTETNNPPKAEQPASKTAKLPQKDIYTIGFSQCTVVEPWRVQMNKDVEQAAGEHKNLKLLVSVADDQVDKQVNDVENFIARGADVIIISPKETAQSLTDAIAKAYQKGIPVIVLDRRVIGDQYTTFIGSDNKKIGYAAGKFIAKALDGKGKIVELKGNMASAPGQARHQGFLDALHKYITDGSIQIIKEADVDWKEDKARDEMESTLAANPEIDLVYGHNDPAAHGAHTAAEKAGRADKIKFVGIDALPQEGLSYVKEGVLDATFEYPTGGKEAINLVMDMIAGKETPRQITLGTRLFTKDNVANGGEVIP